MNKYLTIMVTVLVATQVIRIVQNSLNLYRQNRLIKAQLSEISDVTEQDLSNKREVDKLLLEILPIINEAAEEFILSKSRRTRTDE